MPRLTYAPACFGWRRMAAVQSSTDMPGKAPVEVRPPVHRVEADGRGVVVHCLVVLPQGVPGVAPCHVRARVLWVEADGRGVVVHRLAGVALVGPGVSPVVVQDGTP